MDMEPADSSGCSKAMSALDNAKGGTDTLFTVTLKETKISHLVKVS